jgi:hypothetical protein
MTASRNSDADQTPDLPGFRVFGAGSGGHFGPFRQIFNALKIPNFAGLAPIFNALKIYQTTGGHPSNQGGIGYAAHQMKGP